MSEAAAQMDFRQRLFALRSYTPIPFLILMIIFAHPTISSMIVGLLLIMVGEFLRLWGVAIAGSETRTTGPAGGTYLITDGPFAHVRNPLYLGNMIMYFGVGIMANAPVLALAALIFFLFQYSLIVSLEEEYLLRTFKQDFVAYCKAVPRFVPTLKRYSTASHSQPTLEWRRGFASERRTFQAIGVITVVLLVLWYVKGLPT